jgi:hypothetical protein
MDYRQIDPVIDAWAGTHGVSVYREYKETEVRSVERRVAKNSGYQIWIEAPDADGLVGIHVWDFRRSDRGGKRRDFLVSQHDLRNYLESALIIAQQWIADRD